jgi:ribulose-bisphosphate carboxylase large chain
MNNPASRHEFTARYFVESSVASEKIAQVIAGERFSRCPARPMN